MKQYADFTIEEQDSYYQQYRDEIAVLEQEWEADKMEANQSTREQSDVR